MGEASLEDVRKVLKIGLNKLLGQGAVVLEVCLSRMLKEDMYQVFYYDPKRFYLGLEKFIGNGSDAMLKILSDLLIKEGFVKNVSVEEFIAFIKRGDRQAIIDSLGDMHAKTE